MSQIRCTSCIVSACVHYSALRDRTGSTLGSRIGFPTLREPIFNLFLPYPCFRSIFQVFLKQALVVCEQQQVHLALAPVVYTHLVASLHLVALVYSLFFLCFCPLVRPKLPLSAICHCYLATSTIQPISIPLSYPPLPHPKMSGDTSQQPQTPPRDLSRMFEELRTELGTPPVYQSTVSGTPHWRENISLWDKETYLQRAKEITLPEPSPPRLLEVELRPKHYELMEYPRNFRGMEVEGPYSEPTPLDFGCLDDEVSHPTHGEVTLYVEKSIRPLNEKVQNLLDFSHTW